MVKLTSLFSVVCTLVVLSGCGVSTNSTIGSVDPGALASKSTIFPGVSGNVSPEQKVYLYVDKTSDLHYSLNGGPEIVVNNVLGTAPENRTVENGVAINIQGNDGEQFTVRFYSWEQGKAPEKPKSITFNVIENNRIVPIAIEEEIVEMRGGNVVVKTVPALPDRFKL